MLSEYLGMRFIDGSVVKYCCFEFFDNVMPSAFFNVIECFFL